jgi:hypothetical protein
MAEPITNPEPHQTYVDPDWNTEQTEPMSPARSSDSSGTTAGTTQRSTGTAKLVSEADPGRPLPQSFGNGDNVEQRAARTPLQLPYADAGITGSQDSAYAEAALVFGERDGIELRGVQVSGQVGRQSEVNATLLSLSVTTPDEATQANVTTMELDVGGGVAVGEDSVEVGGGAHAKILSVEMDQDLGSGNRISMGAGVGVGVGGSVGATNIDGDDHDEYCLRVSAFGLTAGGCLELGQVAEAGADFLLETFTPD